jgi:hypothetical protein
MRTKILRCVVQSGNARKIMVRGCVHLNLVLHDAEWQCAENIATRVCALKFGVARCRVEMHGKYRCMGVSN